MSEKSTHGGQLTERGWTFLTFADGEEEKGQQLETSECQHWKRDGSKGRMRTEKTSLRTLSTLFSSCSSGGCCAPAFASEVDAEGADGALNSFSFLTV